VEGVIQFAKHSALRGNAFNMDGLLAIIRQTNKVMEKGSGIHQGKVSISELNNSTLG
jgi:transcription elongation factor